MNLKEAIEEIKYAKSFNTSGIVPRWEAIETVLEYVSELANNNVEMEIKLQKLEKENKKLKSK